MTDYQAYHRSLGAELAAIKDRVRNLIHHWPTDGSFKEGVLRNVLRRHLPESLFIGTGFIVAPTECSKQLDVLVLDKDCPRVFWDGELVIVTPDAVRAVIEVKTGLARPSDIRSVILKMTEDRTKWYRALFGCNNFFALFAYEERGNHEDAILRALHEAHGAYECAPDCVVYGDDLFVGNRGQIGQRKLDGWISCRTGGMAAAALIGTLIAYFSRNSTHSNPDAWQPPLTGGSVKYIAKDGNGEIEELSLKSDVQPPSGS